MTSGTHIWVIDAIGPPKVVQALLRRLQETKGQGASIKLRTRRKDGAVVVAKVGVKNSGDRAPQTVAVKP